MTIQLFLSIHQTKKQVNHAPISVLRHSKSPRHHEQIYGGFKKCHDRSTSFKDYRYPKEYRDKNWDQKPFRITRDLRDTGEDYSRNLPSPKFKTDPSVPINKSVARGKSEPLSTSFTSDQTSLPSPIVPVKKGDGTVRLCVDFRVLMKVANSFDYWDTFHFKY